MSYQFIKLTDNLIVPITSTIMEISNQIVVCVPGAADAITLGPDDGLMLWQVLNSKLRPEENVMTLDVAMRWMQLQEIVGLGVVPEVEDALESVSTRPRAILPPSPKRGRPPGSRNRPKVDYDKVQQQLKGSGGLL